MTFQSILTISKHANRRKLSKMITRCYFETFYKLKMLLAACMHSMLKFTFELQYRKTFDNCKIHFQEEEEGDNNFYDLQHQTCRLDIMNEVEILKKE